MDIFLGSFSIPRIWQYRAIGRFNLLAFNACGKRNKCLGYAEGRWGEASQHAYRRRHSTQTCLVEVVNHIYKLMDAGRYAAIASLDLSKAFDSISHTLLLEKLSNSGISENTLDWVKSYLTNRKQRTKFKNYTSTEEKVSSGVPQGSIIGPLLFICFTNDLPQEFKENCKIVAYADDTQLIIDARNLQQLSPCRPGTGGRPGGGSRFSYRASMLTMEAPRRFRLSILGFAPHLGDLDVWRGEAAILSTAPHRVFCMASRVS